MKTAIYATSHALAAAGVAMLALSSPAAAASDHSGAQPLGPSPGFAATPPACQGLDGPQMEADLILTPGLQHAR